MAVVLYGIDAKQFRSFIRPSLVGGIGRVEPTLTARIAEIFVDWMTEVINETMAATEVDDEGNVIRNQLRGGIRARGLKSLRTLSVTLRVKPYLYAMEYGKDGVTPKSSKFFTIPIFHGLRSDGTPKFRKASAWKRYGSFVWVSPKTGKKFLAYKSKTDGGLKIIYALVEKIDIPARLGLRKIALANQGELFSRMINEYVRVAINSGVMDFWGKKSRRIT